MAKTRRVVFSFDERSLESLQKITEQAGLSMATQYGSRFTLSRALQTQAQQVYRSDRAQSRDR